MLVEYAHCSTCGMEWLDRVVLPYIGRYANGDFVRCTECDGAIGPGNYVVLRETEEEIKLEK